MDFEENNFRRRKEFYYWEMESGLESSQQKKKKPVTHGLEDQKRVSDLDITFNLSFTPS